MKSDLGTSELAVPQLLKFFVQVVTERSSGRWFETHSRSVTQACVRQCAFQLCTHRSKPALIDSDSSPHGLPNACTISLCAWPDSSHEFSVFGSNIFQ